MLECAYNKALFILDAEQYCHYYGNEVVTDELPAGALDGVTSNTTMANNAVKRARVPAVRDIVMFCAMMKYFILEALSAKFSILYNMFTDFFVPS